MVRLKTPVADLVAAARARIEEIDTRDAFALLDDPGVVFVDLREQAERDRMGFIPGSFHCPRGMLEFCIDPESPYFNEVFAQDRRFVFHCASGWRSALSVAMLQDMGFPAAHLKDGFNDWVAMGGLVSPPESRG